MRCPNCQQDAPTVVRAYRAYCTACGAPRPITTAPEAVNVAGRASKVGGGVAKVLGFSVLGFGTLLTIVLALIANLVAPGSPAPWVIGALAFVPTLVIGLMLVLGGKEIRKAGEEKERDTKEHAIFALAARSGGSVTVADVARALSIRNEEADDLLTTLAKQADGRVSLEVDDSGELFFLFPHLIAATRVRVDATANKARVATPWQDPQVIDAQLVEEAEHEAAAAAAAAGARRSRS